jgi:hypothetical protein
VKVHRYPILHDDYSGPVCVASAGGDYDGVDLVGWQFYPAEPFEVDGITYCYRSRVVRQQASVVARPMFELIDD